LSNPGQSQRGPAEREVGELRSDVRGIADQVKDLRRVNSEERQANAARLEGMARDLCQALPVL